MSFDCIFSFLLQGFGSKINLNLSYLRFDYKIYDHFLRKSNEKSILFVDNIK